MALATTRSSSPRDAVPQGSAPGSSAPRDPAPQGSAPGRSSPGRPAPAAPAVSLYSLGVEHHRLAIRIESLAGLLDSEDPEVSGRAIAELEEALQADADNRNALAEKADAWCFVIEKLRADVAYKQAQAERITQLATANSARADRLEITLITVLSRLQPGATCFELPLHRISSRRLPAAVEITDRQALPQRFLLEKVRTALEVSKTLIKEHIEAEIAQATEALEPEAAERLAQRIAATAVPGALLRTGRKWSIGLSPATARSPEPLTGR